MKKRRTIGSAFELSPAEKLGRWAGDNVLRLLSAIAVAIAFWIVVDLAVDLLNFVDKGGMEGVPNTFSHNDPLVQGIKLVGSPLLAILVATTRLK